MRDKHNVSASNMSSDHQGEVSLVSSAALAHLYDELTLRDDRIEELEAINRELWRRLDAEES